MREQQIPFAISRNILNAVTLAAMDSAEKEEELYGPFDSVTSLMETE